MSESRESQLGKECVIDLTPEDRRLINKAIRNTFSDRNNWGNRRDR